MALRVAVNHEMQVRFLLPEPQERKVSNHGKESESKTSCITTVFRRIATVIGIIVVMAALILSYFFLFFQSKFVAYYEDFSRPQRVSWSQKFDQHEVEIEFRCSDGAVAVIGGKLVTKKGEDKKPQVDKIWGTYRSRAKDFTIAQIYKRQADFAHDAATDLREAGIVFYPEWVNFICLPSEDELIQVGFSRDSAKAHLQATRKYQERF